MGKSTKRNKTVGNDGYRIARKRMLIMAIYALKSMGAANEFIDLFYKKLLYISDSVVKGYMSYDDMNRALKEENDTEVTGRV